jgi:hypothetical protein
LRDQKRPLLSTPPNKKQDEPRTNYRKNEQTQLHRPTNPKSLLASWRVPSGSSQKAHIHKPTKEKQTSSKQEITPHTRARKREFATSRRESHESYSASKVNIEARSFVVKFVFVLFSDCSNHLQECYCHRRVFEELAQAMTWLLDTDDGRRTARRQGDYV